MDEVNRLLDRAKGKRELADLLAKSEPLASNNHQQIESYVKRLLLEAQELEVRAARRRDSLRR